MARDYPKSAQDYTTAPDTPDSLTSKAQRVLGLVSQASSILLGIESHVHPPTPTNVAINPPTPDPSHVVFSLQEAEQRLGELCKRLEALRDAI